MHYLRCPSPRILVGSQAINDGCTQITEACLSYSFGKNSGGIQRALPSSFSRVSQPHQGDASARPNAIPDFLHTTTNAAIPGAGAESSLPPSPAARPPPAAVRCFSRRGQVPPNRAAPRPGQPRPAPSGPFSSPAPAAGAQARGPRDLRSRGPSARCCASHPGRGFGPGPLTHLATARQKSWCFLRAAAQASPSTHPTRNPTSRPAAEPSPLGPLSSPKSPFQERSREDKMAAARAPSQHAVRPRRHA